MNHILTIMGLICMMLMCACVRPKFRNVECQSDCFIFEGEVYDPNNDVPLDATVELLYSYDRKVWDDRTRLLATTASLRDGSFSLSVPSDDDLFDRDGYFILSAARDGFLEIEFEEKARFDLDTIPDPINNSIFGKIPLRPKAWLKFEFDSGAPGRLLALNYSYQYAQKEIGHSIPDSVLEAYIPSSRRHLVGGDQFVKIYYDYIKRWNNERKRGMDSIYVPAGQTTIYEVYID
ncbi:MAG: hypothetical protein MRZ79_17120 [Bacteroidia bacterium]|nr:hypothetical protein [Bacteroidia bacterium]